MMLFMSRVTVCSDPIGAGVISHLLHFSIIFILQKKSNRRVII